MKRKSGEPVPFVGAGAPDWAVSSDSSRRDRWIRAIVTYCFMVLVLAGPAESKKKKPLTKTIQGEVLDAENNPIAGASVELTDVTTGKTLGIYSEAGGRYHFTDLRPTDDYQVRAAYKGQQSDVRHASSLDEEGVKVLNLTIPASQ